MLITKKRLIDACLRVYFNNDADKAEDLNTYYFNCGNANAVNYLCSKFGIDLSKYIVKRKNKERNNLE